MISRYKRRGWFGDSQGHSLAARGITSRYHAKKRPAQEAIFFAAKEEGVSASECAEMLRKGMTFDQMMQEKPDVDRETLRQRGIRAWESQHGNNSLSTIDRQGVDMSVRLAMLDPRMKRGMMRALQDRQGRSLIPDVKAVALEKRLQEV